GDGSETVLAAVVLWTKSVKQQSKRESASGSETVQIVRTVVRLRLVCVRYPHPHQSARHPRVHVPLCMGGPWRRTDDAEVASRLGAPSPANHRSPIASPSRSFVSFLFLLCLSLRLVSAPSLPPPTPPPPPDRRAFSASSPFARFIYPPVDFSLFFQPLSLSSPIWLLKKLSLTPTHCSLSRSIITSDAHFTTIGFQPASADPSLSAYQKPHTGSSHRHPSGSAEGPRGQPIFLFFPG
ncbi:hypothetical protein CMEL01_06272, partial [Colletotrichum melonis]